MCTRRHNSCVDVFSSCLYECSIDASERVPLRVCIVYMRVSIMVQYAKEGNLQAVKDSLDSIKKQGVEDDLRAAAASLSSSSASVSARRTAADIIEYLDMADYSNVRSPFNSLLASPPLSNRMLFSRIACLLHPLEASRRDDPALTSKPFASIRLNALCMCVKITMSYHLARERIYCF